LLSSETTTPTFVIKDYGRRNFSVHTGLAGVVNPNPAAFESMCAFALNLVGDCMLSELHILGNELRLEQAIPHYPVALEEIDPRSGVRLRRQGAEVDRPERAVLCSCRRAAEIRCLSNFA
jgi:hypothetical protein